MRWLLLGGLIALVVVVAVSSARATDPGFTDIHKFFVAVQVLLLPLTLVVAYIAMVARGGLRNRWVEDRITRPLQRLMRANRREAE